MAGHLLPSNTYATALYRGANLDALGLPEPMSATEVSADLQGVVTATVVPDFATFSVSGVLLIAPSDAFYERVYLSPMYTDLGLIVSDQGVTYTLWNGYRYADKALSSWVGVNDADTTMAGAVTPPYTMAPLEELSFNVTVSPDGAPILAAEYVWTVGGSPYTATIEGVRSVVFPYAPNWREPVTETLEWRTDVHRSYDGSEQRVALRSKPRRGFEYRTTLWNQDAARLRNTLHGRQNRTLAMPVWMDRTDITGAASAGDTALTVGDITALSFAEGQPAVLMRSTTEYEAVLVEDITGGTITLRGSLVNSWGSGTPLYPLTVAHLPSSVPVEHLTGSVLQGSIAVQTSPIGTEVFMPVAAAPSTYNGYEVLLTQPNWIRPVSSEHTYAFEEIDNGTGAIQYITTEDFPRETRRYSWTLRSRAEIKDFRAFLARRKGQAKPFYAPTWCEDFTVATAAASSGQLFIDVTNNEFYRAVGVDPTRDRLLVRMWSGQTFYRRITGVADLGGGVIRLSIDSTLGLLFQPGDFLGIHIMQLCRFATDKISLQWLTDSVATVETSIISVRE